MAKAFPRPYVIARNCIFIRARSNEVWPLLADVAGWPRWVAPLRAAGDRRFHLLRGPSLAYVVAAQRPEKLLSLVVSRFGVRIGVEARLVEITEGAVVTIEVNGASGVVSALFGRVLSGVVERSLVKLKACVEQDIAMSQDSRVTRALPSRRA